MSTDRKVEALRELANRVVPKPLVETKNEPAAQPRKNPRRQTAPLTVKAIEKLRPETKPYEVLDSDGLYLTVRPSGAKSFNLRYRYGGRPRNLTIGPVSIGLAEGRRMAAEARGEIARGGDPCGQKNERKALALAAERARKTPAADTISAIVERYLAEYVHVPHMKRGVRVMMRPSSRKEIERLLRVELIPKLGDRRLEDSQDDIDNLLKTIAKRAPVIANRLLAWLRAICKWANKNHLIAVSPCEGIDPPGMESSRDRVLTDAEIRLFWLACEREGWPFGVLAKALLLTGQRRDEVGAMTWSEVNLTKAEWLLAGERVKNGRAHLLPLTAGMIRLLDGAPRIAGAAGYVFSTSGDKPVNGFSRAKVRIDAAMLAIARADDPAAEIPPWTFHDLRRTAASNLAALRTKPHVIESVLNHRSGAIKGVAAIYNRYDYFDEKREALEKWERRVERIAAGEAPSIAPREAPDVWEFGGGKTAAE